MGWLTGWSYRKSITLSRASGAVENYQMKLLVGESSGATGEDVDCGGKCLSSFNDLRFTTSDGETLLDYWIESISGTTPNQLATVWIEFDSIGTSATEFFMYYGNAAAPAYSNGADTFLFYDDGSGDLSKWTGDTASAVITGGVITLTAPAGTWKAIYSNTSHAGDIAIRTRANLSDGNYSQIAISVNPIANAHIIIMHDSSETNHAAHKTRKDASTVATISNNALGFGSYHIYELTRFLSGTATARSFTDDVENGSGDTTAVPAQDLYAMLRCSDSNSVSVDWILIRNYLETEAVWGSWSAECSMTTVTSGPLAVTAGLSGTPWPELQQVTPGPMAVAAGLSVASVLGQFVVTPAQALAVIAFMSVNNILSFKNVDYVVTYVSYLTPSPASGLSALTIPMSSFQGRFKSGDPSYLSAVTPDYSKLAEITARVDPDDPPELSVYMVKTFRDGNSISELMMAVDLEDVRTDKGTVNQSITLEGHRTNTYPSKAITLNGSSYNNLTDGKKRYRCSPDLYLRPGDTVTIDGDSFTADNITISISVDQQTMEVSEDE